MGREIKRVALDFKWPINKTWEGFVQPEGMYGPSCEDCNGTGQTHSGWWLQHFSQRFSMLVEDTFGRGTDRDTGLHPWLKEDPYPAGHWEGEEFSRRFMVDRPSGDMVDLMVGLSKFMGKEDAKPEDFGGIWGGDDYLIYRALVKASGIKFGGCAVCDGEGTIEEYEGQRQDAENWEPTEPPAGEGWQVWETVSEGSPISPVFADREGLIRWLMSPAYTWGTSRPLTREQAENFVNSEWAPTGFIVNGEVIPGDQLA
jgi:hypothetical protein